MAKKAELIDQAQALGLEVNEKNTIAELEAAIKTAASSSEGSETTAQDTEEEHFAKSGKRSKKAADEAEAEVAKEERKAAIAAGEIDASTNEAGEVAITKGPIPVPSPRIERRSKRYQSADKLVDHAKTYDIAEAADLAQKSSTVKFDASVDLHINLGVDPKHADQNIRGNITLPHGNGKSKVIAVFAAEELHQDAKDSGADLVYSEEFIDILNKEIIEFDVLIATPENMPKLGKFAKILGPKGLMPNPKSGTVTKDVAKAVAEAKAGKVEFRVDKGGIVHITVGKVSFDRQKLVDNINAVMQAVIEAKPSSLKTEYIVSVNLTTSMGPSVRVNALSSSK